MINIIVSTIYYLIIAILVFENICEKALSASLNKFNKEFPLKLYKENNFVASKTKIYPSLLNATYFIYRAANSGTCCFNFSYLRIDKTRVTELRFINVS